MYRKFDLKKLLLILVILVAIVAIVLVADSKKGNRSFRASMFESDTAKVTRIVLQPKSDVENIVDIRREKDGWKVGSGNSSFAADAMMVNDLLGSLTQLKTLRVAGNDKSKWNDFEVTDSTAMKVKVYTGRKLKSGLYIGRFNYQQPKNRNPYDYNQRGTMSTYVRLDGEKTVYLVEGFLAMTFNRSVNDFRNKTIIKADAKDLTKLTFTYPADSSYILLKENGKWMINGIMADSALVAGYLNSLGWTNSQNISDDARPAGPLFTLKIDGNNFTAPVTVNAFVADTANKYFISSSQNDGVYFSDEDEGLIQRIFAGKSRFLQ
jgi:hypothetical protein